MKGGASTWLVALSELRHQVVKKPGEAGKPRESVTATATAEGHFCIGPDAAFFLVFLSCYISNCLPLSFSSILDIF